MHVVVVAVAVCIEGRLFVVLVFLESFTEAVAIVSIREVYQHSWSTPATLWGLMHVAH